MSDEVLEYFSDAFERALDREDWSSAEFYANKLVENGCEP